RVVEHLREMFRRAGRGSMVRAARALGLHGTFYSEKRHRQRFDAGALVATLRELDISLAAFFAEIEGGGGGGLPVLDSIHERPTPETRQAVRLAYRRMRAELGVVDLVAELEDGGAVDESPAAPALGGAVLGAAWIEGLDGRRQDEPAAVAAELAAGLGQVNADLLPRVLGAWSSALCLMLELEAAGYLNRWALRLAQAAGDSATVADLYVRRSYVVADAGDHARALTLAELAAGMFARLGDRAGEGRALVDAGRWLHYLGRRRESIAAHTRALDLLPDSEHQYRLAAFCNLGYGYLASGDPHAAERCLSPADPLVKLAGSQDRAKVMWLRASICRKLGRLDESENWLRQVLEVFRGLHAGEAALAACALLRVVLEQNKPAEATRICRSLRPLLEPLRQNRIVDAAVGELVRVGAYGTLSLDLVRQVKAAIEAERARTRREWRALAVVEG
ncbi:MAG: tetratricopeptide repeat protein, partial [Thermoanaerobaculia bacterium]